MISSINNIQNCDSRNFFLIAGPCVIESESTANSIAEKLLNITNNLKFLSSLKAVLKKRTDLELTALQELEIKKALEILKKIGESNQIPTITDIHEARDAQIASEYVDVLQIPAFLARQTDLLVAAAEYKKAHFHKKRPIHEP